MYAPKSVLDAARGNVLHEHAEALSYMERDMAEGVAEMVFADTSIFSGGYPELTERLAKLLDQPEFLADLNERLLGLAEAYAEDKSVMRMQFYRPDKVSERFQKFALPYQPYQAREGFQWNTQKVFITEDEINAFLAGGGPYSDGRLATYSFFLTHTEKAERAAFLKDRYGVGGSSHALSRADDSHASYDGRGLELARGIYGKPDALVKLKWNQAAERVARLIDQSLYLKPADYSRMPNYEREQMANRVIGFYHRLPDEAERPFKRELLNEDRPKNFRGRPFGVGDVIVINQQGEITAYFVDKDSLVVVAGFIRSSSSGILVTLDTKNLFIDGCAGTWMATEECVVESQHFFLMQHEVYKEKAPNVIVDASGKLVSTEIRKGLDEDARKKILDYLHPPLMEKPMNQKPSLHQMEHYQKFYENGEYVRAVESTMEQNYNMIDGCANNLPKPRIINGRESVLDKLRIRQMAREKQKSSQEQSADMERNRK